MANRNQETNQDGSPRKGTSNRGFASMDAAQQREIARLGGAAVSGNREHMAKIGRKGGEASAESRASARSARLRNESTAATGSTPRDPIGRGYADDGGQARAQDQRSRGGEFGVGYRGVNARARSEEDGRVLVASGKDKAVEGSVDARKRDDAFVDRNLGARSRGDEQGNHRGLSGRGRDDDDRRGTPVGAPRNHRDE